MYDDDSEIIRGTPDVKGNLVDGWQVTGSLFARRTAPNVSLNKDFPEADTYSVQFSVLKSPSSPVVIEADIFWSVAGGAAVSRTVSVANGTTISGQGQGVKVVIRDATPALGGFAAADTEYVVGAQVSKGGRSARNQPPIFVNGPGTTENIQTITALAVGTFNIPVNAGPISAFVGIAPSAAGALAVQPTIGFRNTGLTLTNYAAEINRGVMGGIFLPIPPGANQVVIQNNAAVDIVANIIYGIDG